MDEDGEQDAVHAGSVLERAHGPGPSPDFAESSFDGVGGSYFAAFVLRFVTKAGQQLVEIVAQASDGPRIKFFAAAGEAAGGRECSGTVGGVHDLVQRALDLGLIGL